jgi:hypothetical protein
MNKLNIKIFMILYEKQHIEKFNKDIQKISPKETLPFREVSKKYSNTIINEILSEILIDKINDLLQKFRQVSPPKSYNEYPLFLANLSKNLKNLALNIEKNVPQIKVIHQQNVSSNIFKQDKVFFAFNHTAGRFNNAFPRDTFMKLLEQYSVFQKETEFIIIEFGLGNEKTAVNNPAEVSVYYDEKIGKKFKVIKFWYTHDTYEFVAPQNIDSFEKLRSLI